WLVRGIADSIVCHGAPGPSCAPAVNRRPYAEATSVVTVSSTGVGPGRPMDDCSNPPCLRQSCLAEADGRIINPSLGHLEPSGAVWPSGRRPRSLIAAVGRAQQVGSAGLDDDHVVVDHGWLGARPVALGPAAGPGWVVNPLPRLPRRVRPAGAGRPG